MSVELATLNAWKKKMEDLQTKRTRLLNELLDILDKSRTTSYKYENDKARLEAFNKRRIELLSPNHQQGWTWTPSIFRGLINLLSKLFPNLAKRGSGSQLRQVLSQDIELSSLSFEEFQKSEKETESDLSKEHTIEEFTDAVLFNRKAAFGTIEALSQKFYQEPFNLQNAQHLIERLKLIKNYVPKDYYIDKLVGLFHSASISLREDSEKAASLNLYLSSVLEELSAVKNELAEDLKAENCPESRPEVYRQALEILFELEPELCRKHFYNQYRNAHDIFMIDSYSFLECHFMAKGFLNNFKFEEIHNTLLYSIHDLLIVLACMIPSQPHRLHKVNVFNKTSSETELSQDPVLVLLSHPSLNIIGNKEAYEASYELFNPFKRSSSEEEDVVKFGCMEYKSTTLKERIIFELKEIIYPTIIDPKTKRRIVDRQKELDCTQHEHSYTRFNYEILKDLVNYKLLKQHPLLIQVARFAYAKLKANIPLEDNPIYNITLTLLHNIVMPKSSADTLDISSGFVGKEFSTAELLFKNILLEEAGSIKGVLLECSRSREKLTNDNISWILQRVSEILPHHFLHIKMIFDNIDELYPKINELKGSLHENNEKNIEDLLVSFASNLHVATIATGKFESARDREIESAFNDMKIANKNLLILAHSIINHPHVNSKSLGYVYDKLEILKNHGATSSLIEDWKYLIVEKQNSLCNWDSESATDAELPINLQDVITFEDLKTAFERAKENHGKHIYELEYQNAKIAVKAFDKFIKSLTPITTKEFEDYHRFLEEKVRHYLTENQHNAWLKKLNEIQKATGKPSKNGLFKTSTTKTDVKVDISNHP